MPNDNRKQPRSTIISWLGLRREELSVFLLATLALFSISASNVLFNNFAETTFLKRFGIHFLPTLILVNAIVTFVVMSFIGRLLHRLPGETVLRRVLLFCALAAALARLAVPLDFSLLYPLIYVMKTQFELLLTFLFWNLANQIFSTRQSKRMFPLMVPGGIVGGLLGSLATPLVARIGSLDNILWAYFVLLLTAALLVGRAARAAYTVEDDDRPSRQKVKPKSSVFVAIREALPAMRGSGLVRGLVLLTLVPNMVVPLLNYQVSFAVDMTYANEASMLHFYSAYRGVQFGLALLISLFAGRIYRRFGLSGGLMVHPVNYLIVFAAFMLQFDILTAVYAGISVGVIRRAIQTPARAALIGLFPNEQRVLLMPFLRGVVVRIGALVGAVFVLVCQSGYFAVCRFPLHPQNLAPFGFAFTLIWLVVAWRMKKQYPEMVLELLGWKGNERGRVKMPREVVYSARNQLEEAQVTLSQAVAVRRLVDGEVAERLVEQLATDARRRAIEVLRDLEVEDPSGRLETARQAVEEGNARQRSNAVEALEPLVPHSLAYGLVLCLEKNLQQSRSYPGEVLKVLASGRDSAVAELAARLLGEGKEPPAADGRPFSS